MGFLCTHGAHIRKISFIILLGCQDFEKHLDPRCPGPCMARCTYQLPKTSMDPWLSGGAWDDETRIFFHLFWCYFIVSCQNWKVTKTINNPAFNVLPWSKFNSKHNFDSKHLLQNTYYSLFHGRNQELSCRFSRNQSINQDLLIFWRGCSSEGQGDGGLHVIACEMRGKPTNWAFDQQRWIKMEREKILDQKHM